MMTAWRLAARELRAGFASGLRGFGIFLACLALGVAAIAAVGSVHTAILTGLDREGAALLGGDAELGFTYRFATDEERAWMDANAIQTSEITDFRSMAVVARDGVTERALTQIKSVDTAYPLVGAVTLEPAQPLDQALAGDRAIMQRVLADRLGLAVGDRFRLGAKDFTLSAILVNEPDSAAGGFALGPRTILRTQALEGTGLLAQGTLFDTKYRLTLPEGTDLAAIQADAEAQFENAGLRWTDARNGAPGVRQFVDRLGAFLVLVGLSGLAVGGVGVSAAVRSYLGRKTNVIATLKTLGASRRTIFLTYGFQIGVLTLLGLAIGLLIGALAPLAFAPLIEANLPVPAVFTVYAAPLFEAAIYGVLAAAIFTLWPLAQTETIRAATLFRDALSNDAPLPRAPYLLAIFVLLAALVGVAIFFSSTVMLTLWTFGGIVAVLAALSIAARGIRWLSTRLTRLPALRGRTGLRLALGAIGGPKEQATSVVLSLGLGLSVLAAVGQIDGNLRSAIERDLPDVAPSYFFVDIQNDQLEGFRARLDGDAAVSRVDSAPMLRGIITQINGRPAREVAGGHWVLEGDRGVTYTNALPENTRVTAGQWWPEDYTGPPQISFAAEEAEEMGLSLGDTMTVNILGRDITGTITSFREVDFSTAGIGFILSMNPAALSGAPHTHIATVYAEEQAEAQILRDLASAYPNITAIRVRDAINRVADLLTSLAAATSYGAAATLLTGFLVLIGAAAAGEGARTYEAAVLKTLGASRRAILSSFALRSLMLGGAAGAVALVAGIGFSWAVITQVMEVSFAIVWPSALGIIAGGIVATLVAGLLYAWRPLAARPAQILRAKE
ncbi:ABC transporter permease [Nereida sp. MMG025]|uniref:ABC transporter permease n=1 Tax=Nereida sp. MMG025 TaxID=2909981 RepID=UPI001F00661D|nr:FtsX-like permease family protein [Nereida sp. MMG025]MCF6445560.1 FtsX-like permease family protein [Nereida sp. MMG025]